jgi:hypothetical protein
MHGQASGRYYYSRVVAGGSNNDESFTTLDGRRGVALVALMLVDGEGFAGDGRLVDLKEGLIGNNTAISGNDGAL